MSARIVKFPRPAGARDFWRQHFSEQGQREVEALRIIHMEGIAPPRTRPLLVVDNDMTRGPRLTAALIARRADVISIARRMRERLDEKGG